MGHNPLNIFWQSLSVFNNFDSRSSMATGRKIHREKATSTRIPLYEPAHPVLADRIIAYLYLSALMIIATHLTLLLKGSITNKKSDKYSTKPKLNNSIHLEVTVSKTVSKYLCLKEIGRGMREPCLLDQNDWITALMNTFLFFKFSERMPSMQNFDPTLQNNYMIITWALRCLPPE